MRTSALVFAGAALVLGGALSPSSAQGKGPNPAARDGVSPGTPQATPPAVAPALPGETMSDWRASKLIGTTMTNTLGETIGSVSDVVIDADGKVVAVLVSVGGFLGLGETTVAIGLRHLVISHTDAERLEVKTALSRKAIEQAASVELESDRPAAIPPR